MGDTRNRLVRNEHLSFSASQENLPLTYFLLVFILSVPFWAIGGRKLPLPMNLPVSSFMWINPLVAASILSYRESGQNGVKSLLKRAIDYRKITNRIWYIPILFLVPAIYGLSYLIMRLARLPLPDTIEFPVYKTPLFFLLFFVPAMSEEIGWSGYALDPMQKRWSALKTSLVIGLIWQVWHFIPDIQAGHRTAWIVWHSLYSVALRIFMVSIYNNSNKSVFAATLVHIMDNVSWSLFPNYGSHLDPAVTALVAWVIAAGVIAGWGPKTLAHWHGKTDNKFSTD